MQLREIKSFNPHMSEEEQKRSGKRHQTELQESTGAPRQRDASLHSELGTVGTEV